MNVKTIDMFTMTSCKKKLRFCNGINSTCIFIVGDFNADISKTSVFGSILHDFCNDFSFSIADKDYLPAETYTYVSPAWGTTSWLDHVICTADARGCVTDMTVLYECICSDHHPLLFSIDFGTVPAYDIGGKVKISVGYIGITYALVISTITLTIRT